MAQLAALEPELERVRKTMEEWAGDLSKDSFDFPFVDVTFSLHFI